jgi:hypothetical protein
LVREWRVPQASAASFSIISPSAAIPAARQKRSKLAETSSKALPTGPKTGPKTAGGKAVAVVIFVFMALLSFLESTPQAYGLKASNAAPPFSTAAGTSPFYCGRRLCDRLFSFALSGIAPCLYPITDRGKKRNG